MCPCGQLINKGRNREKVWFNDELKKKGLKRPTIVSGLGKLKISESPLGRVKDDEGANLLSFCYSSMSEHVCRCA